MSGKSSNKKPREGSPRLREQEGEIKLRLGARRRSRSPGPAHRRKSRSPPRSRERVREDRPRSSPRHDPGSPAHRSGLESSPGRGRSPRLGDNRPREASRLGRGSPSTSTHERSSSPAHGRIESDRGHRTRSEDFRGGEKGRRASTSQRRDGRSGGSSPKRASPQGTKVPGRSREYRASPLSRSSSARDRDHSTKDQDKKGHPVIRQTPGHTVLSFQILRSNSLTNVLSMNQFRCMKPD
jgi:hypothetical protein